MGDKLFPDNINDTLEEIVYHVTTTISSGVMTITLVFWLCYLLGKRVVTPLFGRKK